MSKKPTVAELVAAGYGVSKLRSAGVSCADIRAAGFTIQEMYKHLSVDRLVEAGFVLEDFQRANFPVATILGAFSVEQVLRANPRAFPLSELLLCADPATLRTVGKYTAEDFYVLGNVSCAELKRFGFTTEEIAVVLHNRPAPPVTPHSLHPPHAASMAIGEEWRQDRTSGSRGISVTFKRVPKAEAEALLANPIIENRRVRVSNDYGYDGTGHRCPRCGRHFVLLYNGYGSIFVIYGTTN